MGRRFLVESKGFSISIRKIDLSRLILLGCSLLWIVGANEIAFGAQLNAPAPAPVLENVDDAAMPPGDDKPLLRIETDGPRSYVSGLAFSPDSGTLYSGGWDKAVQVWNRNKSGQYEYSQAATLRVPTGSGLYGGLNALALSPDGKWLAVGGQGHARDMSTERSTGWILPAGVMSTVAQLDEGLIYVFNTTTRTTQILRGHRGPVQSLAFVSGSRSNPPELVSVAEERTDLSNEFRPYGRLWDVANARPLASLEVIPKQDGKTWVPLPALQGWRPGLAAWSTGQAPAQVRVAIAWGDDQFRIWDAQTGQVATVASSPNTLTVLPIADGRFMTGAHGDIGVWSAPTAASGRLGTLTQQQYQPARIESVRAQNLPSAVAMVPRRGEPPLAMFVVSKYTTDALAEYRLIITTTTSPTKVIREFELPWRGEIRIPSLAVSKDGTTMAVAGNDANEVFIYSVEDLITGKTPRVQVLKSRGLNVREATFVRAGDQLGVAFNQSSAKLKDPLTGSSLVLDIEQRRMAAGSSKWRLAAASLNGWSAEAAKPGELRVHRSDQPDLILNLEDQQVVSSYAFCPPTAHCRIPLVAVASHLRGQPLLRLFRGDTGEPLRWCVGHTERVRSLNFADDGRMLVSVGDDRTTSLWSLVDLVERNLDQHGRIPDVTVQSQDERVVVTQAPAGHVLHRNDELVSIDKKGEAISLRSSKDFYQAALESRPREKLTLNVRRDGQMNQVTCDVGQAIDESKPLATLMVIPGEQKDQFDWIVWHPLGNFDASDARVERLLGWQFNTGEQDHPARFAPIGEYRESFYRRNLLKSLVDQQKLVLLKAEEKPQISLWLRYPDGSPVRTDYDDVPQVDVSKVQLVAELTGISSRRIQALTVAFNDGTAQPLVQTSEREWMADLSSVPWKRGEQKLNVRLQSPDHEVVKTEKVQFRPAAPTIEWTDPVVNERRDFEVNVKAAVIPADEPVQVELRVLRAGQKEAVVVLSWETRKKLEIDEVVGIEPGENELELVAYNSTAPESGRRPETAWVAAFARRSTAPKVPQIALNQVTAIPDLGEAIILEMDGSKYRTAWPTIRLNGLAKCTADLDSVSLEIGEQQQSLDGFQPGRAIEFPFDQTVTLRPGPQEIVLRAAVGKEQDAKRITVTYEPPLPQVVSLTTASESMRPWPKQLKSDPDLYYSGYHNSSITVRSNLEGHLDSPYRVSVLVNDTRVADEFVKVDRNQNKQHTLTAKVPLQGGQNRISVRVENDWSREPIVRNLDVGFRRPPEIVKVFDDEKLGPESQTFAFQVKSVLPVRAGRVLVDGKDERRDFVVTRIDDKPDEWLLKTNQIGLSEGDHALRILASNEEGITLEPTEVTVHVDKPPVPPPVLTLLSPVSTENEPEKSLTVNSNKIRFEYLVRSKEPASVRLTLRGNNEKYELFEKKIESDKVPIDGSTGIEELELFDGVNEIEVVADSAGGSSEKQIVKVAYVVPTATVEVVSVGGLLPRIKNDGTAYLDRPLPKSRATLIGRVRGLKGVSNGQLLARVWVNKFILPTIPIALDEKKPGIGQFEMDVVFNSSEANEIEIQVFRLEGRMASELGSTTKILVDCISPEREQELYVLLLGNGDTQMMRHQARTELLGNALQARPVTKQQSAQEVWESNAFSRIHVHDALNVPPAAVQNRLREMVGKMLRNLRGGSKSGYQSLVMIYYQGQITMIKDDFAFGVVDSANPQSRLITGRILEENLTRSYGAHVILLDLQQAALNLQDTDIWPKAPHLGIAVWNWKGDSDQPDNPHMSAVFAQVMPRTKIVRELAEKMDERYVQAEKLYPGKVERVELLKPVYNVRIGSLE